ncbi:MAG: O-antigen ligase family protein, partial [Acidobacteria bacterium]|nr:O-antigen ligase family protein [Acidobacteriota bacterium]
STNMSQQEQFAIGSQEARWRLFVNSLRVTAMHPLLGVGPGNFGDVNAQLTAGPDSRASWQQTHNAYTQVSSECGIPAGIAFLALVIITPGTGSSSTMRLYASSKSTPSSKETGIEMGACNVSLAAVPGDGNLTAAIRAGTGTGETLETLVNRILLVGTDISACFGGTVSRLHH